jgi:HEAT repeat protein
MTIRRKLWVWLFFIVVVISIPLIPGSPLHLRDVFYEGGRSYDNHSADYWIRTLESSEANRRQDAVYALGSMGAEAPDAVSAIARRMLVDTDDDVRIAASLALLKMLPVSRTAVAELAKALGDTQDEIRMNAALTLSRLRQEARPAIPALLKALEHEGNDTNVNVHFMTIRQVVILALGRASSGDAVAVPALLALLNKSPTMQTRLVLARALGEIGVSAKTAIPALEMLLTDPNPDVSQAATRALRQIQIKTTQE